MFSTVSRIARLPLIFTAIALSVRVVPLAAHQSLTCSTPPVEPCVKRHGRLSSQNGITVRLWLIGTKRVVFPSNLPDALPSEIGKYLELTSDAHSYIFGDFIVCPLEPDTPGRMRQVCVTAVEKLVIQPHNRPGHSFQLASTWPPR